MALPAQGSDGTVDGVYVGVVSMGLPVLNYEIGDSRVEIVISGGSRVEIALEFTLRAGLRYVDDVLVCTATTQASYRGSGSVVTAAIESDLTLEGFEVVSVEGSTCGVSEPSWTTTIEQDLAADFASEGDLVFTGVVVDGVVTGSAAEGVFGVSAFMDPTATTENVDESGTGAGSTQDTQADSDAPADPASDDGRGVSSTLIAGGVIVLGGIGATAGLVRSGKLGKGRRGPGPEEPAGYGGMPGSARVVIDMLERSAMTRSTIVKTWRAEGIEGLDRLAREQAAQGVATKNPGITLEANQALSVIRNPDFAGHAHPPPRAEPPPSSSQ